MLQIIRNDARLAPHQLKLLTVQQYVEFYRYNVRFLNSHTASSDGFGRDAQMSKRAVKGCSPSVADSTEALSGSLATEIIRLSEEPLRLLVNGIKDYAIILLDPQGRVVTWNEGARHLKGYSQGEIVGRSMELFYPPDAVAEGKPAALLARAISEGRVEDEGWRVRKDGSRFFADVILTPIRDTGGKLVGFAKITRNISERRQAEEALRLSEERFRLLVNAAKDYAIIMLDPYGRIVTWNEGARRLKGYSQAEIIGHSMKTFYPADAIAEGKPERLLAQAAFDGRVEDEGWRVRKDGSRFFADVVLTAMRNSEGALVGFAKITRDISARRATDEMLRASEARYRLLADNTTDVIMLVAADGKRLYVSPACRTLFGYEPDELINLPVGGLVHPSDRATWAGPNGSAPSVYDQVVKATYRCIRKDGSIVWVESSRHLLSDELGYVVSIRDITERKQIQDQLTVANRQLQVLATHDVLTSLANRRLFDLTLEVELRRAARHGTTLAILMMDIDHFKQFNDRYGHLAGDECIRSIGGIIKDAMQRPGDLAARYGGEEFVALLPTISKDGAEVVADKILKSVRKLALAHYDSPGGIVTISIGLVTVPPQSDAQGPERVLREADERLYCAKRAGRNQVYSENSEAIVAACNIRGAEE